MPGRVDAVHGVVSAAVNLGITEPVPMAGIIGARLGVPVHVENDVNAAALGTFAHLGLAPAASLAYVNVGTGIAAGFVLGGRLWRGATGGAGEIGHVPMRPDGPPCRCGQLGCAEAVGSGRAVGRRSAPARRRHRGDGVDGTTVRDDARRRRRRRRRRDDPARETCSCGSCRGALDASAKRRPDARRVRPRRAASCWPRRRPARQPRRRARRPRVGVGRRDRLPDGRSTASSAVITPTGCRRRSRGRRTAGGSSTSRGTAVEATSPCSSTPTAGGSRRASSTCRSTAPTAST